MASGDEQNQDPDGRFGIEVDSEDALRPEPDRRQPIPEDLPEPVARLVRRLLEEGFGLLSDVRDPDFFGNRLLVYRRAPVELRLIKDRSQWTVDMKADGWDDHVPFPLFHGFALE